MGHGRRRALPLGVALGRLARRKMTAGDGLGYCSPGEVGGDLLAMLLGQSRQLPVVLLRLVLIPVETDLFVVRVEPDLEAGNRNDAMDGGLFMLLVQSAAPIEERATINAVVVDDYPDFIVVADAGARPVQFPDDCERSSVDELGCKCDTSAGFLSVEFSLEAVEICFFRLLPVGDDIVLGGLGSVLFFKGRNKSRRHCSNCRQTYIRNLTTWLRS